jgi:hypothetical protein
VSCILPATLTYIVLRNRSSIPKRVAVERAQLCLTKLHKVVLIVFSGTTGRSPPNQNTVQFSSGTCNLDGI